MAAREPRTREDKDGKQESFWSCIWPQPATQEGNGAEPSVRYGHAALLHDRSMIVTHGYYHSSKFASCFQSDTWAFDVDTHEWQQLLDSSSSVPTARFEHAVASDGEFMYMFGGTDGGARLNGGKTFLFGPEAEMNDLWRVNLNAPEQWEDVSGEECSRPEPRCEHGLAWAGGKIWLFGGLQGDESGTADGLRAAGDLWSWSEGEGWREHANRAPGPRYGHGCLSGCRSGSLTKDADGFFVVGGRQRNKKEREIIDEVWWADASSGTVVWQALATPSSTVPSWSPRFHFAACTFETMSQTSARGGLIVYGGNVSTGLLRLPVDGAVYLDEAEGSEGESNAPGWAALSVEGPVDPEGQVHPYGRVHATVVLVPPNSTESSPRLLIFGGESTRPYMYHASVWEARLSQPL